MLKNYIGKIVNQDLKDYLNTQLNFYEDKIKASFRLSLINQNINFKEDNEKMKNIILDLNKEIKIKLENLELLKNENKSEDYLNFINKVEKRYNKFIEDIDTIEKNKFLKSYLENYNFNNSKEKINKDLNELIDLLKQKFNKSENSIFFKNMPKVKDCIKEEENLYSSLYDKFLIEKFIVINSNKIFTKENYYFIFNIMNKFEKVIESNSNNQNISFTDIYSTNRIGLHNDIHFINGIGLHDKYNNQDQDLNTYIILKEKEDYYRKSLSLKNNEINKFEGNKLFYKTLNDYIIINKTLLKSEIFETSKSLIIELKKFNEFKYSNKELINNVKKSFSEYETQIKKNTINEIKEIQEISLEAQEVSIEKDLDKILELIETSSFNIDKKQEQIKDNTLFYTKNLEKVEKKEEIQEINYL